MVIYIGRYATLPSTSTLPSCSTSRVSRVRHGEQGADARDERTFTATTSVGHAAALVIPTMTIREMHVSHDSVIISYRFGLLNYISVIMRYNITENYY